MKTRKKKLFASVLSLLLVMSMVLGNLGNVQLAKADNGTTDDTIQISFFDYQQDPANINSALLGFREGLGNGDQNIWHEASVYQGIVAKNLVEKSSGLYLPQFNYLPSAQNADLFNPNAVSGSAFKGSGNLTLIADTNGYYTFDSANQGLTFDGTNIAVNPSTAGFWPLDSFNTSGKTHNEFFGISFVKDFYLTRSSASDPYTFTFSGDDDVWIFIDNVLVLDIGGIHGAIEGEINFTTGDISYKYVGNKPNQGTPVGNPAIIDGTPATLSAEEKAKLFKEGSHTLSFFYLERGAVQSNCKFSYNFPITNYTVKHAFQTADGTGYEYLAAATDEIVSAPINSDISLETITKKTRTEVSDIGPVYGDGTVLSSENTEDIKIGSVTRAYKSATKALNGSEVYVLYPRLQEVTYELESTDNPTHSGLPVPASVGIGTTITVADDLTGFDPAKWTFTGWHTKAGNTNVTVTDTDTSFTMPAANVILYGRFAPIMDDFTVTYEYTGAVPPTGFPTPAPATSKEFQVGSTGTVVVAATPTGYPDNYTFTGWALKGSDPAKTYNGGDDLVSAVDVTLVGDWAIKGQGTVTINYYKKGTTEKVAAPVGTSFYNGESYTDWVAERLYNTTNGTLAIDGLTYILDASATTGTIKGSITDSQNVVINQYFDEQPFNITYSYSGETPSNASALPAAATQFYNVNTNVAAAATTAIAGWTFLGWSTTDATVDYLTTPESFTMPKKDVAFTGTWEKNQIIITVEKKWTNTEAANIVPVTIELQRNGRPIGDGLMVTLDGVIDTTELDPWSASFGFFEEFDDDGKLYEYTVIERYLGLNYKTPVIEKTVYEQEAIQFTVTNEYEVPVNPTTYTLTVNTYLNGNPYSTVGPTTYAENAPYSVTYPATVTSSGTTYSFDSSVGALSGTMDSNKVVDLYYTYVPVTVSYRVSYVLTDATGDNLTLFNPGDAYYNSGDFVTIAAGPALDTTMYRFSGWSTSDIALDLDAILGFAMPSNNITIYGTVTKITPEPTPSTNPEPTPTTNPEPTPTTEPVPTEPEEIIEPDPIPEDEPEIEEIIEDDLPTDLPETGTVSATLLYLFAAGLVISGLAIRRKHSRKQDA